MKLIERITLVLFSTLMLIISVIYCLLAFGWLEIEFLKSNIELIINDPTLSNVMLGLNILFILLAIRCIFFDSSAKKKEEYKNGILLENASGKLLITRETIENLVNGIAKGFDSAKDVTTKIELDKDNNVTVFVNLNVKENAVIKELSNNLQTKVKSAIKKASDLEVKEVNVSVRNLQVEETKTVQQ